jgi:putative transposase
LGKAQRFEVISDLENRYPITLLCRIAEVSRAGFYKWKNTRPARMHRSTRDGDLKEHILAIHRLHPYYGYIRMRTALQREGLLINQKKVRRLMRELEIRSVIRKKRPFAGRKPSVIFENVLAREFTAEQPAQKLVTDITYVRVGDDFIYLSAIQDLYNNEIIAWEVSTRNDLQLVLDTVRQLKTKDSLLHSDQGFQYTSKQYASYLQKHGLTGSHSRRGNCFDNACIESFFSHLKTEKLYLNKPKTETAARESIADYIRFYNSERFQKKLSDLSPREYREKAAA